MTRAKCGDLRVNRQRRIDRYLPKLAHPPAQHRSPHSIRPSSSINHSDPASVLSRSRGAASPKSAIGPPSLRSRSPCPRTPRPSATTHLGSSANCCAGDARPRQLIKQQSTGSAQTAPHAATCHSATKHRAALECALVIDRSTGLDPKRISLSRAALAAL